MTSQNIEMENIKELGYLEEMTAFDWVVILALIILLIIVVFLFFKKDCLPPKIKP